MTKTSIKSPFHIFGYCYEFWQSGRMIGMIHQHLGTQAIGHEGRRRLTARTNMEMTAWRLNSAGAWEDNPKSFTIKEGPYEVVMYPLCGKMKRNIHEAIANG